MSSIHSRRVMRRGPNICNINVPPDAQTFSIVTEFQEYTEMGNDTDRSHKRGYVQFNRDSKLR